MKLPKPKKPKTQSRRLRAVLFLLWEQEDGVSNPDEFYKVTMEKIINHYKNKLTGPYRK